VYITCNGLSLSVERPLQRFIETGRPINSHLAMAMHPLASDLYLRSLSR